MNLKKILFICIVLGIFTVSAVAAEIPDKIGEGIKELHFNISSDFQGPETIVNGIQYEKADGTKIIIHPADVKPTGKGNNWTDGFEKQDGGRYKYFGGEYKGDVAYTMGEFFKINNKAYWIQVSGMDLNGNDKVIETLNYFETHNNIEIIK